MVRQVEFINYTGEYPCLCSGEVTLKIDGEVVEFCEYKFKSRETGKPYLSLSSGSSCGFNNDYTESYINNGDWEIELDPRYEDIKDIVLDLINKNVPYGCCGGCL